MLKMIDKSVCDQFVVEARLAVKDESRTIHSPEVSSTIKEIYDFYLNKGIDSVAACVRRRTRHRALFDLSMINTLFPAVRCAFIEKILICCDEIDQLLKADEQAPKLSQERRRYLVFLKEVLECLKPTL